MTQSTPQSAAKPGAAAIAPRAGAFSALRRARRTCFASALLIFLAATGLALLQPPSDNPYARVPSSSSKWWLSPIEFNAEQRLPVVTADFNNVFAFTDANDNAVHVWAVGDNGLIIHSDNGGLEWQRSELPDERPLPPALPKPAPYEAAAAATREFGMFGPPPDTSEQTRPAGTGKEPNNGGGTFAIRGRVTLNSVDGNGVPNVSIRRAIAGGSYTDADGRYTIGDLAPGTEYTLTPRGRWQSYAFDPASVSGTIAASDVVHDFVAFPITPHLYAVAFLDARHGWAAGEWGAFYTTADGGVSWQPAEPLSGGDVCVIRFSDLLNGHAYFADDYPQATGDGGKSWDALAAPFAKVGPAQPDDVTTRPAGARPLLQVQLWVRDDRVVRHDVDAAGTCRVRTYRRTGDPGVWTVERDSAGPTPTGPADARPWTIRLASQSAPFALDRIRIDASAAEPLDPLHAVCFLDANRAWAVGQTGLVVATRDGGRTWFPQTRLLDADEARSYRSRRARAEAESALYVRIPGPWYWFLVFPVVVILLVPVMRPAPVRRPRKSVANVFASDRPLEAGDPDPLDFHAIAAGLSRFLRNKATEPPLTIAITGEWGSGKSSLMNLLHADLKEHGLRTVWFNAWHHQKEEHLLAALLENIRAQAVPAWYDPRNIPFRLRLLARRLPSLPVLVRAGLIVIALVGGFALATQDRSDSESSSLLALPMAVIEALESQGHSNHKRGTSGDGEVNEALELQGHSNTSGDSSDYWFAILGIVSAGFAGTIVTARRYMRAFGVNPARLMASMTGKMRVRDLQAQCSLRYRFKREFQDVTSSLRPRVMVIVIDDLDRCRPNNVLDILEAVNFLVSCGGCYVILGMARNLVEGCVGLSFKDVAEDLTAGRCGGAANGKANGHVTTAASPAGHDEAPGAVRAAGTVTAPHTNGTSNGHARGKRDGRECRRRFACNYLEKLINIQVPVPHLDAARYRALLTSIEDQTQAEVAGQGHRTRARQARRKRAALRCSVVTTLALLFGYTFLVPIAEYSAQYAMALRELTTPTDDADNTSANGTGAGEAAAKVASPASGEPAADGSAPPAVGNRPAPPTPQPRPERERRSFRGPYFFDGAKAPPFWVWALWMVATVVGVGVWRLTMPPPAEIDDSTPFRKALDIWYELVRLRLKTPRALKRFVNRVRLYAAYQHAAAPPRTRGGRSSAVIRERTIDADSPEAGGIPEPTLVALAAIQHFNSHWLTSKSAWERLRSGVLPPGPSAAETKGESDAAAKVFAACIRTHRQTFKGWAPDRAQRDRLREISRGMHMH